MSVPSRSGVVAHPPVLRTLRVVSVTDLGHAARQVVVGGDELGSFNRNGIELPAFVSPGPEDHVKLVLARPGEDPVLPEQLDGQLVWPDEPAAIRRDVSVRHFDPTKRELTLQVVDHDGPGPLTAWVSKVAPGDRIHLSGPRSSRLMPQAGHMILVGEVASLAAIARWTQEAPADSAVTVVVAVPGVLDERPIVRGTKGRLDVRWLRGGSGSDLLTALGQVERGDDPFVFVGAENEVAKAARTLLRDEWGLSVKQFRCVGYWRAD